MMQDLVGIVRTESEMRQALDGLGSIRARAAAAGVAGNREYNPGWHTALDLHNLVMVAEAVTRAAIERRESRGAQFRTDFPDKDPAFGKVNIVVQRARDGDMEVRREPIPSLAPELAAIIEEMK
jgi:succinate dehydrogenase / fumarate reductase flavoprotein subunit